MKQTWFKRLLALALVAMELGMAVVSLETVMVPSNIPFTRAA